jgi:hypothetical protein
MTRTGPPQPEDDRDTGDLEPAERDDAQSEGWEPL